MAVQFIHRVVENCPESRMTSCGGVLLSALNKLVSGGANKEASDSEEVVVTNAEKEAAAKLRASCYVAIGKLGLKMPQLVNKDITILTTFFEAMSTEDKETQMSVQEALSMMAPAFKAMESKNLKMIEALIATYIEKDEHQVRHVAVQYAGEVFPPSHTPSKFTLLLGAGDLRDEVSNTAKSHLYGLVQKSHGSESSEAKGQLLLPDFLEMTRLVIEKASQRVKTQQKVVIGSHVLPFTPAIFTEILKYLRMCLLYNAGVVPHLDMLRDAQTEAPKVYEYISQFVVQDAAKKVLFRKLLEENEKFLKASQGTPQAQSLLQLIGCSPKQEWCSDFQPKMSWLKSLLNNTKEDFREVSAQLYGQVAVSFDMGPEYINCVNELVKGFKDKPLEYQHGALYALAFTFKPKEVAEMPEFKQSVELMIKNLSSESHALLMSASCFALGELGRCGSLPIDNDGENMSKKSLYLRLQEITNTNKLPMKVRERSAIAVGQLCIGDDRFPWRQDILKGFLGSAREIKDIELHFTIGEALCHATLGPLSDMGRYVFIILNVNLIHFMTLFTLFPHRNLWRDCKEEYKPMHVDPSASDKEMEFVLDELINKYSLSSHPNEVCLFLLCSITLIVQCTTLMK